MTLEREVDGDWTPVATKPASRTGAATFPVKAGQAQSSFRAVTDTSSPVVTVDVRAPVLLRRLASRSDGHLDVQGRTVLAGEAELALELRAYDSRARQATGEWDEVAADLTLDASDDRAFRLITTEVLPAGYYEVRVARRADGGLVASTTPTRRLQVAASGRRPS